MRTSITTKVRHVALAVFAMALLVSALACASSYEGSASSTESSSYSAPAYSQEAPQSSYQAPPSATTFQDYGRSDFVATVEDSVSTFSLDTDRTSYQLALNWARDGYTVDPDSVRAEEWINAFNYDYELPAQTDSFAITADAIPHPLDGGMHLVRLGFQAPEFRDDAPLNVTLVLDASGSMADGNRVDIARTAAETIRRSLRSDDRLAVVHFDDGVISGLTVQHTGPDDRDLRDSIDDLRPRGSTNVQAGLNRGLQLADRARRDRPNAHNYVVLFSDGVANVDATDPFAILESAYDADGRNPLRLITIGVGINNYNDVLLEQLAQYGNGWYRYLSSTAQAETTFSRDSWLPLSIPFADQTRAQVRWNDAAVESWRLVGYENRVTSDESFTEDRREFAEIPMGAATTVFYEVRLSSNALRDASQVAELGDVQLRWVTPIEGLANRQTETISVRLGQSRDAQAAALLDLGALVALTADRYASLPYVDSNDSANVQRELADLHERLLPLGQRFGNLNAYDDFSFLLESLTDGLPSYSEDGSGYSR